MGSNWTGRTPQGGSVPGPLTFRMIDRVGSSMNSTRTCVTPPREPIPRQPLYSPPSPFNLLQFVTTPRATPSGEGQYFVPVRPRTRVTLTSLTGTFAVSILAVCDVCGFSDEMYRVDEVGLGRGWVLAAVASLRGRGWGAVNFFLRIF